MLFELAAPIASACVPLLAGSTVAPPLVEEEPRRDLFGSSVALLGDVDGDGHDDWLVGAPLDDPADAGAGSAWLFSGKDGSDLWSGVGSAAWDEFGDCVSALGDVDGDELPDFSVGAPCRSNGRPGYVRIYAGSDRRLLRELRGEAGEVLFGLCVAGVGDVDGDGAADVAVSSGLAELSRYETWHARVFSGRDGRVLHVLENLDGALDFARTIALVGDVDGDRCADFFVSAPGGLPHCGRIVSGRSGATLHALAGSLPLNPWGPGAAAIGDLDGDGVPDLAVSACSGRDDRQPGHALRLYSGRTGALVHTLTGTATFGFSLASVGDIDGDDVPDFCAGQVDLFSNGEVALISGRDGRELWRLRGAGLPRYVPLEREYPRYRSGAPPKYLGYSLASAGDADGDGLGDVLIGVVSPWSPNEPGFVIVASGCDGAAIRELSIPARSSLRAKSPR